MTTQTALQLLVEIDDECRDAWDDSGVDVQGWDGRTNAIDPDNPESDDQAEIAERHPGACAIITGDGEETAIYETDSIDKVRDKIAAFYSWPEETIAD